MTIAALPTPPSRVNSPAEFSAKADALLGALPAFVTETNATAENVVAKEASAVSAAATASSAASTATAKEASATASAATATEKAAIAVAAAEAAQTSGSAVALQNSLLSSAGSSLVGHLPAGTGAVPTDVQSRLREYESSGGSSLIGYLPAGTGAVATDVQSKLREVVSVKDFGADPTGVADSTANFINCISNNTSVIITPGTYLLSTVSIPATGANKTLYFMPGVTIFSNSPSTVAAAIFVFGGVSSGFRIVGNGVKVKYNNIPTARINNTIYITGETITDLEVEGIDVLNSGNMAIAVYCGNMGSVAVGSKNINIHNCWVRNTLGDGVHVENADSDVTITDIYGENNGDDVVAVINYTGSSGAPTHPTPTQGVLIDRILSKNANTSTVSLAGVTGFSVNNVVETANSSAVVFTVKMAHDASYSVGNMNGVIDNISSNGAYKILTLDTPAGGTAYNKQIRIGKVVGVGIKNNAISMSNAGAASGGALANIEIDSLEIQGAVASSAIGYISNTLNCHINRIRADSFSVGLVANNNIDFSWGNIKAQAFAPGTATAIVFAGNQNIRCGSLEIDAGNCTTGVQCQSNTGITHDGIWRVKNATANYLFGSNSGVVGYFYMYDDYYLIPGGSVASGTPYVVTYSQPAPSGSAYIPDFHIMVASGSPSAVGAIVAASPTNADMTLYFTGPTSGNTYVGYTIKMKAA